MKNRVRFENGYAYMELKRLDGTVLETVFDEKDIFKVVHCGVVGSWCAQWAKDAQTFYCRAYKPRINGKREVVHLHRLIMDTPDDLFPNHLNFNGLDNRRDNLKNVTFSENVKHSFKRLNVPRGKGYSYNKKAKKWISRVWLRDFKEEVYVKTEEEAQEAVETLRAKARDYFNSRAA